MAIYYRGKGYTNIINKRDTGSYTFTLDKEYEAKFLFVGNGCGGGSSQRDSYWQTSSGGSGACFQGVVKLKPGKYTVTIGTLGYGYNVDNQYNNSYGVDSSDSFITDPDGKELIRVGCGARGVTVGAGGAGGKLTLGTLNVISTTIAKNGNIGGHHRAYGGCNQQYAASAYDGTNTGYGAGKSSLRGQGNVYGVAGILLIDIKEDVKFLKTKELYHTEKIKYYKYVYVNWSQPVFSSNSNTTSGITYTLTASHEKQPAWYAFNGDTTTGDNCWWTNHGATSESSPCWIQLKASKKIKMSKVVLRNEHSSAENFKTGYVQVSNNGTSWTNVATINGTNTASHETSVNISVNEGYYYYRLYFVAAFSSKGVSIQTITFTGKSLSTAESTESDYDYSKVPAKRILLAYKGSTLVYSKVANNQVFNKSSTGTYTFTVPVTGKYKMTFVGNGGGGGSAQTYANWCQVSGGSGAAFEGIVKLKKGVTYTAVIGTLGYGYNINDSQNYTGGVDSTDSYLKDSSGKELIRVGCGARGVTRGVGGAGGKLTLGSLEVLKTTISKNGNTGNFINAGSPGDGTSWANSAYDGTKTGLGAGTASWRGGGNVYGKAGILKIVLV